jgi:hypothetical protein
MNKIRLYNGEYVDKKYFDDTLSDLIHEKWEKKDISELGEDHVLCLLSFETISDKTSKYFYESNNGNIVCENSYNEYLLRAQQK